MGTECPHCRHVYRVFNEEPVVEVRESRDSSEYNLRHLPILATERDAKQEQVFMDHEALHDLQDKIESGSQNDSMERHRRILHDIHRCPRCKTSGEEYEGIWNDLLHNLHGCPYCKYTLEPKPEVKETVHVQEVRKPERGTYMVHDPRECPACQLRYHGPQYVRRPQIQPSPHHCPHCHHDYEDNPPQPKRQLQVMQIPIRCEHCEARDQHYYPHDIGYGYDHVPHVNCPYCDPNYIEKYPDYHHEQAGSAYGSVRQHHDRHHRRRHHSKRRHSYE